MFQRCFLSLANTGQTSHTDCTSYLHVFEFLPATAEEKKLDGLLLSAHPLHVSGQQKRGRQKHFLFVHHFSLT